MRAMDDEAAYRCPSCHEEIVIPVELSAGRLQEYGEDCPVCCRPNLLRVEFDEHGRARIEARPD